MASTKTSTKATTASMSASKAPAKRAPVDEELEDEEDAELTLSSLDARVTELSNDLSDVLARLNRAESSITELVGVIGAMENSGSRSLRSKTKASIDAVLASPSTLEVKVVLPRTTTAGRTIPQWSIFTKMLAAVAQFNKRYPSTTKAIGRVIKAMLEGNTRCTPPDEGEDDTLPDTISPIIEQLNSLVGVASPSEIVSKGIPEKAATLKQINLSLVKLCGFQSPKVEFDWLFAGLFLPISRKAGFMIKQEKLSETRAILPNTVLGRAWYLNLSETDRAGMAGFKFNAEAFEVMPILSNYLESKYRLEYLNTATSAASNEAKKMADDDEEEPVDEAPKPKARSRAPPKRPTPKPAEPLPKAAEPVKGSTPATTATSAKKPVVEELEEEADTEEADEEAAPDRAAGSQ
jgi:hypothetical protein